MLLRTQANDSISRILQKLIQDLEKIRGIDVYDIQEPHSPQTNMAFLTQEFGNFIALIRNELSDAKKIKDILPYLERFHAVYKTSSSHFDFLPGMTV